MFIDNNLSVTAGEFYIIIRIVGYFFSLFGPDIINKDIHGAIPIGNKVDFLSYPHRDNILCNIIGDILYFLGSRIINPNVIRHATAIIFPITEFSHNPVVSQLFSIGGIAAKTSFG